MTDSVRSANEAPFGEWLRAARHEYGYTQQELGAHAHCSAALIRKIEAGLRRPSRPVAEGILAALEVPAPARPALLKRALNPAGGVPAGRAAAAPAPPNPAPPADAGASLRLPVPLTSLIGREDTLAALTALLESSVRLVTLIGPPGIGKTRLALAAAAALAPTFPGSVYFAALAPIRDPALLPAVLAGVLGVPETPGRPLVTALHDSLRERETLLVLDNFEQIVGAAPWLLDLLAACPRLKLLLTSREALHVRGEQLFPVPVLGVPDDAAACSADALRAYPAVALFAERATAVDPAFALTAENLPAVATITRQLGGLPLAIELAAARSRYLTPQAIAGRLHQSLALLTGGPRDLPPRQQTLRAAIAWSYDLLDTGEQLLFRRLGVFAGRVSLAAVEAVCNATADLPFEVFDGLASLVDKSLLLQGWDAHGEPSFSMLEMIQEFALAALMASDEGDQIHRLCAEYYVALAQAAASHLWGGDQAIWLDRLEAEHDNLRVVQRWTLAAGALDLALPLASALARFWEVRGYWSEGLSWVETLLAHPSAAARTRARAQVLMTTARMIHWVRRAPEGRRLVEEALAISREQNDPLAVAGALMLLANIELEDGSPGEAARLYEAALSTGRDAGDPRAQAVALLNLCYVHQQTADLAQAERYGVEGLAILQGLGDDFNCSAALARLGEIALATGRPALASARLADALARLEDLAHVPGQVAVLALLARALAEQARPDEARQHLVNALRLLRRTHETRRLSAVLTEVAHLLLGRGAERKAAVLLTCAAAQQRAGPIFEGPTAGVFLAELHARTLAGLRPDVLGAARDEGVALSADQAITRALQALGAAE